MKIGGSLLDLPQITDLIRSTLAPLKASRQMLVTGGGPTVDLVRIWQQRFSMSDVAAHDLAIQGMHLNAHLLARLLPEAGWQRTCDPIADGGAHSVAVAQTCSGQSPFRILDVPSLLSEWELQQPALPRSWDLTSDSIAALLATHLTAGRLLLLKSVSLPPAVNRARNRRAACGVLYESQCVDRLFVDYAPAVPQLLWCNLRSSKPQVVSVW